MVGRWNLSFSGRVVSSNSWKMVELSRDHDINGTDQTSSKSIVIWGTFSKNRAWSLGWFHRVTLLSPKKNAASFQKAFMLSIFNPQFLPVFSLQTVSHTIPTTIPRNNKHTAFFSTTQWPLAASKNQTKKRPERFPPTKHHQLGTAEESFRSVHFRSSTSIAQQKSRPSTYGGQMELTGWTVSYGRR